MIRLLRYAYWLRARGTALSQVPLASDRHFLASQAALLIGIAYLFVPLDLIPDNTPFIGHLDEFGFLAGGFVAAYLLMPADARRAAPRAAKALAAARIILPNFFLVGGARCGTTSLFDAIGQHPDVFCCPVKEPNFFATDRNAKPHILANARRTGVLLAPGQPGLDVLPRVATTTDYDTYLSLFRQWSGQHAIGEATTSYLSSLTAAREIAARQPAARIVAVLRHPVHRAQSEYLMHAQLGRKMGSLDEIYAVHGHPGRNDGITSAEIIAASLYAPQVRRYLAAFPREQLLFLRFEDVVHAPADILAQIFNHIGVPDLAGQPPSLTHHNQSRPVRFPLLNRLLFRSGAREMVLHLLPRALRRRLATRYYAQAPNARPSLSIEMFRADIEETQDLTGLDLRGWLG